MLHWTCYRTQNWFVVLSPVENLSFILDNQFESSFSKLNKNFITNDTVVRSITIEDKNIKILYDKTDKFWETIEQHVSQKCPSSRYALKYD